MRWLLLPAAAASAAATTSSSTNRRRRRRSRSTRGGKGVPGGGIATGGVAAARVGSCCRLAVLVPVVLSLQIIVLIVVVVGSIDRLENKTRLVVGVVVPPKEPQGVAGEASSSSSALKQQQQQLLPWFEDATGPTRGLHERPPPGLRGDGGGGGGGGGLAVRGGAGSGAVLRTNDEAYDDNNNKRGETSSNNVSHRDGNSTAPAASFSVPLEYGSGTLHVRVHVGTPPQPQLWIVDTGSHLSATSCTLLSHSALLEHYDPQRSTTHQVVPCGSCRLSRSPSFTSCRKLHEGAHDDDDDTNNNVDGPLIRRCRLTQKYTEGSQWTAYEAQDGVALATTNDPMDDNGSTNRPLTMPFTFGCQTTCTGLFKHQLANGILGLERTQMSYVSQLHRHQLVQHNAFSICTTTARPPSLPNNRNGNNTSNEPPPGRMGLGGALVHLHVSKMQYAPIVDADSHGMYRVQVLEVWLGSDCLANATFNPHVLSEAFNRPTGKGTVVDSGTTDTFLPSLLAKMWEESWMRQTGRPWHKRTDLYTHSSLRALPSVTLMLAGGEPQGAPSVRWVVPPDHYMEAASTSPKAAAAAATLQRGGGTVGGAAPSTALTYEWPGTRQFTNRIYVDEPDGAVLGLNAMRGYDVMFDAENRRVGLAPVTSCGGD